jgi:hypothetical protein
MTEEPMSTTTPSKRAIRLRIQAARVQERSLPDHVRRAYGETPDQSAGGTKEEPSPAEQRESARASLVERGHLTVEELDTLTVDDAITLALQRQREQIAALEEQSASLDDRERGQPDSFSRPPRTLHRR